MDGGLSGQREGDSEGKLAPQRIGSKQIKHIDTVKNSGPSQGTMSMRSYGYYRVRWGRHCHNDGVIDVIDERTNWELSSDSYHMTFYFGHIWVSLHTVREFICERGGRTYASAEMTTVTSPGLRLEFTIQATRV